MYNVKMYAYVNTMRGCGYTVNAHMNLRFSPSYGYGMDNGHITFMFHCMYNSSRDLQNVLFLKQNLLYNFQQ